MENFLAGLKLALIGIIASVASVANPITPVESPSPAPSPLNGENYEYVRGTYSYLGQEIKYYFIIPRKGGSFSGSIKGACQAQVGGEYISSNGEIKGKAGGECKLFFMSYKGSTDFKGRLYPESKTLEIEIPNSPIKGPIKLNYN